MPYEPFYEQFGELARRETRSITLFNGNEFNLPPDDYALIELYCADENCDCQRVIFNVLSRKRKAIVAVVAYGWESEEFYYKWFHSENNPVARDAVKEMTGLNLNSASPQSELAPAILEMVRWVISSPAYVARIKMHYRLFKEKVDPKNFYLSGVQKQAIPVEPASKIKRSRAGKRHRSRSTGN